MRGPMAAAHRERRLRPCRSSISRSPASRSPRRRRWPIEDVAADLGLDEDELELYGRYKAKVSLEAIERRRDVAPGKLVAVTAITPTPAGEGKTTTAIGLVDALDAKRPLRGRLPARAFRRPGLRDQGRRRGRRPLAARADGGPEPPLHRRHPRGRRRQQPACGGASTRTSTTATSSASTRGTVTWRRCLDVNDRALRSRDHGAGREGQRRSTRETGFDITAASEVMAILAVARDLDDLRERLSRITVGRSFDGEPVTAGALGAAGSMAVLLKDALKPNLIQTLEGSPALVHAGPFANIAHGNSSLVADLLALRLADYVVTESGFGADMGFEKHVDIVCRMGGLRPSAVVLVATDSRAEAPRRRRPPPGAANLRRHIEIVRGLRLRVRSSPSTSSPTTRTTTSSSFAHWRASTARSPPRPVRVHARRSGRRRAGRGRRGRERADAVAPLRVRARRPDPAEDREGRSPGLRRRCGRVLAGSAADDGATRCRGARPAARVPGEDAPVALARPGPAERARKVSRCRCASSAPTRARAGSSHSAAT